ncbi:MAG: BamA/TamA family outer membrane protein [Pseudomonadota bacterium]
MKSRIVAAIVLIALATASQAAELQLNLPDRERLAGELEAASLLVTTLEEETVARRDVVAAAQADYRRLISVLFERGYFGPVISIQVDGVEAADLPVVGSDVPVQTVVVTVQEGQRFVFGEARIGPLAPGTELPERFAPLGRSTTGVLRETATAAIDGWRAAGHAKADLVDEDIVVNHDRGQVDATLRVDPGPRLSYGPLIIEGNEDVRERPIRRIADLRRGRVFDPDEVRQAARRLQRTGAFRSVSITEAEEIGPDATLPLTVQVVERLPRRFGVGAEVETTQGLSLTAFWLHRNLTGAADSLRLDGEFAGIGGQTGGEDIIVSLGYNRPATFSRDRDLFVNLEAEDLEQPNFSSQRLGLEVGVRRIVSDNLQYQYAIAFDRTMVEDDFGSSDFSMISFPAEVTYDRRDDPLNAKGGFFLAGTAKPFAGFQDGGAGIRLTSDVRGYRAFGAEQGTVFAARLQVATVLGAALDEVPADDLFFSGGGGTVRGQEFQDLGAILPTGEEVGGRSFAGIQSEIRRDISDRIGLVGFVDAGVVSPNSDWTETEGHVGAGLGVRYNTGIGPLRVDIGVPVAQPGTESGFEVYIGIGQAF